MELKNWIWEVIQSDALLVRRWGHDLEWCQGLKSANKLPHVSAAMDGAQMAPHLCVIMNSGIFGGFYILLMSFLLEF